MGRKTKTDVLPLTPAMFPTKMRPREKKRRKARQELCGHPTLHTIFKKKEELGTGEYRYHIRPGNPACLKAKMEPRKNIKMLEEAVDQWKSVNMLETGSPQLWHTSPCTPSLTARLWALLRLGYGARAEGRPSPSSSAGFRRSRNQKIVRGEKKKQEKAQNTCKKEAGRGHTRINNEREARGNRR